MWIAVDAMGGDYAPEEIVRGAVMAARRDGTNVLLVGRPEEVKPLLPAGLDNVRVVEAEQVIEMDESPARAMRSKPNSSMAVAVGLVASGEAAAVVSAGNSGAFMGLALCHLSRIGGIDRPAIAIPIPTKKGERVVLDAGANVDCRPEHLLQFGVLGAVYAQFALGISEPKVALLNIGTEPNKGNELTKAAYKLMADSELNFAGFIEGNAIFDGDVDVIVCDGFVGNVLLKTTEGLAALILSDLREHVRRSVLAKLGVLLLLPALCQFKKRYDYASYGGALLLGVKGICVVCHGRSHAGAIANAIRTARRAAESGVVERIASAFERLRAPQLQGG